MQPYLVVLEVEIYESNFAVPTYKDKHNDTRFGFLDLQLEDVVNIFYNSHLRYAIPDLIAGHGHRKNEIELFMTHEISKSLGFEEVGIRAA